MVDFIKQHGGRVTTSVSSRTTYLIAGMRLEDGRPVEASKKYRTAKSQSNCTIISENDIIQMVQDAIDQSKNTTKKNSSSNNNNSISKPKAKKLKSIHGSSNGSSSSSSSTTTTTTTNKKKKKTNNINVLWVNKYKPNSLDDLVGNATNVKRLLSWLQSWYVKQIYTNSLQSHSFLNMTQF